MGRDSNPRKPCDFSGFQDRRIRPLCHPSETFFSFCRRSFKPAVLFAYRTWRCCSPLVRARLRNLLALLTRTQDRRYCPALPTILNFLCLAYSILIFSKTQINFKIQKIFIKKTLALYALNILTFV